MRFVIAIFLIALLSFTTKERAPGLCLSFDDRSVREWYQLREIFNQYDAHVTFFVSQFDSLDSTEISMLRQLELDGHEIGSHGALHVVSEHYIKKHSYNEYFKNEIDPSVSAMKAKGFNPYSFAYPYGAKYWFTDFALKERFHFLRSVSALNDSGDLAVMDEIYYKFNGVRSLSALPIDNNSGVTEQMITRGIARAAENKEVLLLYGHEPIINDTTSYRFKVDFLKFILTEARKNKVRFFTFKDLDNH